MRITMAPDGSTFHDALAIGSATSIANQPRRPRFKTRTNYNNYVGVETWA